MRACVKLQSYCVSGTDEAVKSDSKAALAIIPCPDVRIIRGNKKLLQCEIDGDIGTG